MQTGMHSSLASSAHVHAYICATAHEQSRKGAVLTWNAADIDECRDGATKRVVEGFNRGPYISAHQQASQQANQQRAVANRSHSETTRQLTVYVD